jgi:hypothetical protein
VAKRQARKCSAHRRDGRPCTQYAVNGALVCATHGGAAPQVKAAAAHRLAEAGARATAEKYGLPVRTTAAQALREELDRSAGTVAYLMRRVQALDEDALTWGTTERRVRTNPGMGNIRGEPQIEVTQSGRLHVLVSMLMAERQHLARLAADMARIGIEARVARISEAQITLLNRVMDAVLSDAQLTEEQQAKVAESFPRRLREVTSA